MYGKGTHPEAFPWLAAQAEEELERATALAVGRLLSLATLFLSTRISQSTSAPTLLGTGKKEQRYTVSPFFLLSVWHTQTICPFHFHDDPVAYLVSSPCFIEFKQAVSIHPRQEDCYGLEAQPELHRKFQANLSYNGLLKNTKPTNQQKSRAFRAIKWYRG